ncbi:MAG: hypothetical protein GY713_15725 [Actinomycetia bacterium]|nr:hypothetical protein [Actinomycetes bacterium]
MPLVFGGTAADPGDYSPSTGTITVPAGQTSADLTLTVVDDGDNENDETVVVTMGVPVNATAGTTTVHTATIEDDEGPEVTVLEPDGTGDLADGSFTVMWTDADSNDDAAIDLFYDTDSSGEDGTAIASGLAEDPDGAGDRHLWDTSLVADGDVFVYAVIDDGVNPPVVDYSAGPLTVDHSAISCAPPASGDWLVSASCTLTASDTAPGDVIVDPGVVLTIDNGVTSLHR